ncbi:septation protein SepH [Kocuria nitroreducens]|uniref:septation protein SepH n=1 Tax=Kocuria nitroreducens TaxID=3058914 RepID=UPI0036D8CED9
MEQLRLAGVHDDGEHLVVEDEAGTRHLLRIDQELRLAVQRARRLSGARQRGTGQFGPREIQARFRSGATVEEIVAESGWESARVRRYEWPILAERAHIATEAQKVEIQDRSAHRGYHSVFEGEPLTLGRAVAHRAADLGVDPSSLEWDSWQREDHLWAVVARFSVVDRSAAPAHDEPLAEWLYNPANQSVRPANSWAEALTEAGAPDTPLGTGLGVLDGGLDPELTQLRRSAVEADDLLDVLQARRGQRIGEDADGDDALAELLGRGMGHVERRPRPLAAPEDSSVFDRPFQPATQFPEPGAAPEPGPVDGPAPRTDGEAADQPTEDPSGALSGEPVEEPAGALSGEPVEEPSARNEVPHPSRGLARERTDGAAADRSEARPDADGSGDAAPGAEDSAGGNSPGEDRTDDSAGDLGVPAGVSGEDPADSAPAEETTPERPRPRNKTAKARRSARSSVPSWDEIVFGSSSD